MPSNSLVPSDSAPSCRRAGPKIWGSLDPFVEEGAVLGRRIANTTFIKAFLKSDPYDEYHFFLTDDRAEDFLKSWLYDHFPALMARNAIYVGRYLTIQDKLASTHYHCMHLSDIFGRYTKLTQIRNAFAANIFPVTGFTHSLSYAHFMAEYSMHMWSGVCARDAIMVSSESARLVLEGVFRNLRQGYGLDETAFPTPRLECLPLGVALEDLPDPVQHWRKGGANSPGYRMRGGLGLDKELLFLCFGRISPSSKMDLMPLFAALQRAEALGLPKSSYIVVLAGWADEGDDLPNALCSYAASLGIRTVAFARPTREERLSLYAAADVFISPSDNIQESFGLTVAEAGAAGLPVIASDFNGYRDIIVHEVSGLLIPTLGFSRSDETDLQALWWFDNQYHLKLAQETVVDVPAMAEAIVRMGTDASLRSRMGAAGRKRVLEHFTWEKVIERYVDLWDKLAVTPVTAEERERLRKARHPRLMRFAQVFGGHFSSVLDGKKLSSIAVRRTATGDALYRGALPFLQYAGMEYMLDSEVVRRLLLTARKAVSAESLIGILEEYFLEKKAETGTECSELDRQQPPLAGFARERAEFTLLWCLKHDYVEITKER